MHTSDKELSENTIECENATYVLSDDEQMLRIYRPGGFVKLPYSKCDQGQLKALQEKRDANKG